MYFCNMKTFIALTIALISALTCSAISVDRVPNVHIADRSKYVSNPDGVLSSEATARLNDILGRLWESTSAEVVVVAVDDLDGMDVNDYATKLFERWGIGKADNDNGLLILISRGDRRAALRTGYGLEGPLPDIVCGRIIREQMAPYFRNEDYDNGTLVAVGRVAEILGDPNLSEEIKSKYANDSRRANINSEEDEELWPFLLTMAGIGFAISLLFYFFTVVKTRNDEPTTRYRKLQKMKLPMLILTFIGLGTPFLFYFLLNRKMTRVRNKRRKCPNCGVMMNKMDEDTDNDYLTAAQDTEERLNSVDYDVWVCPHCNETDIIPFDNPNSIYTICPRCGAKACSLTEDRIIVHPTITTSGKGIRTYTCRNCGNQNNRSYTIPQKQNVPPVVILPGGRGFGGGISGGSFGGGMTGGGGASGGW